MDKNINQSSFFAFTTRRPVAILMVVIGVFVFGFISYNQLPLNLMPDMTYPSLTVRTEYEGTAPEEIETTISRPVEQALGVVDDLVSISSISKADQSDVILEFTWDTDMNKATSDIREKLDQVYLPEEVKRPLILRYDPSLDPIMRLGIYGHPSLTYMRYLAEEEIKRALETVDGVAAVKVKGGLEEEIRVELDEQKLTLIGMDIQTVRNRLSEENVNLAGGNLKEGETEYLVRTLNEFKTVNEISNVVIGRWNGVDIKIKDVGHVYRTSKEREIISRIHGKESVEIEIYKEADANIVSVAALVKDKIYGTEEQRAFVKQLEEQKKEPQKKAEGQPGQQGGPGRGGPGFNLKAMTNFLSYGLPDMIGIETLSDQSIFIKNSIDEVKSTAIMGGLLAILVLFIFLRQLGPTVIIGLSIPISVIATFAPMKIFSVSLNIMSLGGLALGIGMLVDNSIVVLESIARCREEGDDMITATIRGVSEVGGAVIASTLTTIAVFFPIVFVEGVAGQVFGDLALTVVFSLLASLAVALFLIPMLSSRKIETFMHGMSTGQIPKNYIVNFSLKDKINELFSDKNPDSLGEKILSGLKYLLFSAGICIYKILKVLFLLLVSLVKQSIMVLMVLLQIPLFLADKYILKNYSGQLKQWAVDSHADSIGFIMDIWPEFMVSKSVIHWYDDLSRLREFIGRGDHAIRILKLLFLSWTGFAYYLIKYFVSVLLEVFFRIFHALITVIGILAYFLYLVLRIMLTGPANFTVYVFDAVYSKVEKFYPVILAKALDNKLSVAGVTIVLFLIVIWIIGPRLSSELIPEVHQGEFYVQLTLPIGTPVEKTDERIQPIQEQIAGIEEVFQIASVSGTDKSAASESEEGEHTARLTVTLKPTRNLEGAEESVIAEIRDIMRGYPGIRSDISRPTIFSFKTPIEVYLKGYNLAKLQQFSRDLEERISDIEGVVDAKSNIQRGNPEVQIFYNRQVLAQYDLNLLNVASIVRNKVRGDVASEFKDEDRRIDILVRLREDDKQSIDDLRNLVINPGKPVPIPLHAVAEIRINEGPSEIRRIGQQRSAVLTANIMPGANLSEISSQIYNEIQQLDLPNDFSYELAGQNKEMETSMNSLFLALGLAIFLVYIVMASQFESLIHPFVIIFTIPLAVVGVIIFLYIFNIPLSIVVFLGLIMLAGIVVNNAIVLVDYINHLRDKGLTKSEAIIKGGQVRLRPILMTTATTVLGLLPMALGLGDGAEIRTPMAITVIIGLSVSTLLTLIVIPVVYSLFTREQLAEAVEAETVFEHGK
ncbi:MAG: efflux RND transporter permease subunit [Calditrichaceae bacterium]|nr:efflux RND transporter permease subunit [Calditrichaceae bacterium]MBN2709994.1 efflux RND transporter permease subunit [Calditrichaceae bacterium]RQV97332.1 MAG: efflux RND transporter permease subunit [Calditrichota bacterium]